MIRVVPEPNPQWHVIDNFGTSTAGGGLITVLQDGLSDSFRIEYRRPDGTRTHKTLDFRNKRR